MKTLKLKSFLVAVTVAAGTLLSSGPASANEPKAAIDDKYQKDNALIREDIVAVHLHQAHVKQLKDRLKKDRTAGLEEAVIMDKRELCKARADLRKSKTYLSADKTDLRRDYRLAIRGHRDELKNDQANLDKYKTKLNKDIANGSEEAISYDANRIAYYQNELRNDRAMVVREQDHFESNFAAIDKEYNNPALQQQQPVSETAYARTNGKNYK